MMDLMILAEESIGVTLQHAGPLAVPLMILSAVGSAYSAYQGYKAQQSQAENAAAISEYNAQVSEQDAKAQEMRGEAEVERMRMDAAVHQATQKSQIGRSGVLFSGSPLTFMANDAMRMELDIQTALHNSNTAAERLRSQAKGQRMGADAHSSQAKAYGRAAPLAGASALTSGLSQAAMYKASLTGPKVTA